MTTRMTYGDFLLRKVSIAQKLHLVARSSSGANFENKTKRGKKHWQFAEFVEMFDDSKQLYQELTSTNFC